jgi:hypothetical protein
MSNKVDVPRMLLYLFSRAKSGASNASDSGIRAISITKTSNKIYIRNDDVCRYFTSMLDRRLRRVPRNRTLAIMV